MNECHFILDDLNLKIHIDIYVILFSLGNPYLKNFSENKRNEGVLQIDTELPVKGEIGSKRKHT